MLLRTRHQILSVLESRAYTTGVRQMNDGPGHRIRVHFKRGTVDREFECVVLVRSSLWYEHRLNLYGMGLIEMVVCARHDSCLPIPVWSVEEGKVYNPGETAHPLSALESKTFRGSRSGHALFVAAILTQKQEALTLLEDERHIPRSTRYRLKAKVRAYANLKRGKRLRIE
ncbi:hypothetical protein [Ktedonobacter sp. SOSP1-85]|uniref:hypothetical protein n=1 Tax=Ktedonobacter sp. SOSP1-85 TaxID=2778367 RepID=UPI0019152FB1|nr:hypothetical protein [Ktedonobacter sp. SOSP1-85]